MSVVSAESMRFSDLRKGAVARVVAIHEDGAADHRLQEMGLTVGTQFKVIKVAPFGDPVEIDLRGYRLCLRKKETDHFEVEQLESQ